MTGFFAHVAQLARVMIIICSGLGLTRRVTAVTVTLRLESLYTKLLAFQSLLTVSPETVAALICGKVLLIFSFFQASSSLVLEELDPSVL